MQFEFFSEADFQQETPFTRRSVCLLGRFHIAPKALRQKLQTLGADIKQGVNRNLHYVVLGEDAPADALEYLQQLAYHGYQPRMLSENDLEDILQGHYSPYTVPEQTGKNLHLTLRHYLSAQVNYDESLNPLYMKELYLAPDVQPELYQKLGNQGVYANAYIDDTTDVLVLSDNSLQHLREGGTDDSLHYIEQQYNQSRAQTFRFSLTSEGDLLTWLKNRN